MNKMFALQADNPYGCVEQAKECLRQHNQKEALRILKKGTESFKDSAYVWNAYGVQLMVKRDDDNALKALKKAHNLEPDNRDYKFDYAGFLGTKGHVKESELLFFSLYDHANPQSSKNVRVLLALGKLYAQAKDYEHAGVCYGQCLEIHPAQAAALKFSAQLSQKHSISYSPQSWTDFVGYAYNRLIESLKPIISSQRRFDHG